MLDVKIDVIPNTDAAWPWKVRITSRDPKTGDLVGVRNLRSVSEEDANERATRLRGLNARDDIAREEI